ncbi:hypothetical protein IPC64_09580 [Pseudomonas aeruginosa]|uniref:hypothetical protein n=1 Tax=Pseudomonas aeruginosa TaxID=287 RepID=UPI00106891E3|nr:hypothetical protein [Pseudomonas aeruginosa]TEP98096.1 hypothetical protein IPC64_09580 [Pseudomonas aeruginosa]
MTRSLDESTIEQIIEHTKDAVSVVNAAIPDEAAKQNYFQVFHKHQPEILLIAAIPAINAEDRFKIDRLLGAQQLRDTINNTPELFKLKTLMEWDVLKINPTGRRDSPSVEFHHSNFPTGNELLVLIEPERSGQLLSNKTEIYSFKGTKGTKQQTVKGALLNAQTYVHDLVVDWKRQNDLQNEKPNKALQKQKM